MARYIYDSCAYGSWHDGGLGSTDDLDLAIRKAARLTRGTVDAYAIVTDTETGRHIRVNARDCAVELTPRRALRSLRDQAATDGWARPAHRPRRDPSAARVTLTARVHPDTRKRLDAARAKTGEGLGELIDRLAVDLK